MEEKLDLNLDDDIEVPSQFYQNMKNAINSIYEKEFRGITDEQEDEIIQKLYNLHYQLQTKNFEDTIFSHEFFDILKKVISFSEGLHNQNLNNAVNQFFNNADELFNKEMKKEDENQMKENKERCDFIRSVIIPKTNQIVLDKEKTILDLIDLGKYRCLEIINDEIKIIYEWLKESNKDVEKAARLLEQKIKNKIDEINKDQEKEINLIVKEKEDLLKDKINEYYEQKTLFKD